MIKLATFAITPALFAQQVTVTYFPYLSLGDNGPFGATDQIVVAWQTSETSPNNSNYSVNFGTTTNYGMTVTPTGRTVDNYLSVDPSLPTSPTAYGAHSDYVAVLSGLAFDTTYYYRVNGPGMGTNGFTASFHTRKQSSTFSFAVEGDEGYFPAEPTGTNIVDYEARIAHLIYNAGSIALPNSASRPSPDLILNTGDNVYNTSADDGYRDFYFPVFNNDTDSVNTGAPIIRSMLYFVVDGNHDLGSTGVSANLLADNSAPRFSGNVGGGDALSWFNNMYYPLNGPTGYDINYSWNGDSSVGGGMYFQYQNQNYTSPSALAAYRASTTVNTGQGNKAQIDHMSNYSFDYGNTHFLYLDADPHLFNSNLPGGSAYTTPPPPAFSAYPTALREWVINDLDSSKQMWKVVVFHQPSFSSGDATILNNQMRAVAKVLEDHGVNIVFNGHEHNYQRTYPIRSTSRTAALPSANSSTPAVNIDTNYDGASQVVPDGVLYIVEGGGGNRDFDGNLGPPRGSGTGVDQDDSATGTSTPEAGLTVPQGPSDWLDTNLTNREMVTWAGANSGMGPKITVKFKSKVFSFGHVLVNNNTLTLYQITEPLKSTSSGTTTTPAPYGTDYSNTPLNDPEPDTVIDANGNLLTASTDGTPALLDQWTITKPNLGSSMTVQLSAPPSAAPGGSLVYTILVNNNTAYSLNGSQVRLTLPSGTTLTSPTSDTLTVQGSDIVATLGRVAAGTQQVIQIQTKVPATAAANSQLSASASLYSGTAEPVATNTVTTKIVKAPSLPTIF